MKQVNKNQSGRGRVREKREKEPGGGTRAAQTQPLLREIWKVFARLIGSRLYSSHDKWCLVEQMLHFHELIV